jgi:hypothetical protein
MKLGNVLLKAMADHAIQSDTEGRLMNDANEERKRAGIQQDLASKEINAAMQQFQGYVNIAMSTVNVVQQGQKLGQTVSDMNTQKAQMEGIGQDMQGLREDLAALRADPNNAELQARVDARLESLRGRPLGESTVGERFSDDQLKALASGDVANMNDQQLRDLGFTDSNDPRRLGEIHDLKKAAGDEDGFTSGDATGFMWGHRRTEAQEQAKQFKEDLQKAIKDVTSFGVSESIGHTRDRNEKEGKRGIDDKDAAQEMIEQTNEQTQSFQKKVDEVEIEMLRDRTGSQVITG